LILEKFPNHVFFLSTLVLRTNKENKQSALGIIKRFVWFRSFLLSLFRSNVQWGCFVNIKPGSKVVNTRNEAIVETKRTDGPVFFLW